MSVRKIGGYVSVNKVLGKPAKKNDAKVFVAGGETIDRKIEAANRRLLKKQTKQPELQKANNTFGSLLRTFFNKIFQKLEILNIKFRVV